MSNHVKEWIICYRKPIVNTATGEEENAAWPKVGRAFQYEAEKTKGEKIVIRMDALPIENQWDGVFYLFPAEQNHADDGPPPHPRSNRAFRAVAGGR